MSDDPFSVMDTLSAGHPIADDVASVICGLIVQGHALGEMVDREYRDHFGTIRTEKVPPKLWFDRLERAINVGAFNRLTVIEIVDRILLPPLPEKA